ncbi:MAG: UvrD-helicase domain-containing protein [Magnetococcales bacterium]|nr:UvrD-helicase domain-containing protein [Magnetococcales bacterium]
MNLIDQTARDLALDVHRSFIVQAPAGSGKTGLLTQRILALLGRVEQPEEILAITFTRKAAREMKDRVLQALDRALIPSPPESSFDKKTWILAREVRDQDRRQCWRLQENPFRLRIMTIDAFCHFLVRQLPLLTEMGGQGDLAEHPERFYRQAAHETLDVFDDEHCPWRWAVLVLFGHLDNDWEPIENMLSDLLARRDQWLRHVGEEVDETLLARLDESLAAMVGAELAPLSEEISRSGFWEEIMALMAFATHHRLADRGGDDSWIGRKKPPDPVFKDVSLWHSLAETLLTTNGTWRKRWDKRLGFPPGSKAASREEGRRWESMKQRVSALVDSLRGIENLEGMLDRVRHVPAEPFSASQWRVLQALLTLLKVAAGHLLAQFSLEESVDHLEVARRAILALGGVDDPSDLALRLDHRLRHILVDEFQDTSRLQYELLERLVTGWNPDQGNTLFLVGDPMQSIYRFREAEVGLFLQVQRHGMGPVRTEPLFLEVNFRSTPGIVDWVNDSMRRVFPRRGRPETGAVEYAPSRSVHEAVPGPAVVVEGVSDRQEEGQRVAILAEELRCQGLSVCILVRTRGHLDEIIKALDARQLRYQAVDLHPLARRPVVQDLLTLTRALLHPDDRIAWLALLRAPWSGLSLADLHAIATFEKGAAVHDCCNHPEIDGVLSADGRRILSRIRPILQEAWNRRGEWSAFPGPGSLRRWIEGTWRRLGGGVVFSNRHQWDDAGSFFALLERLEVHGTLPDLRILEEEVATLYSTIDPKGDPELAVMTIHKAKGLEFDCVIIPGIDRGPRTEEARLLMWMEPPVLADRSFRSAPLAPLLAPIGSWDGGEGDPIYTFVARMEQEKVRNEVCRLLYVAVTRARRRLHLVGCGPKEERNPVSGSFLAVLWPLVAEMFSSSDPGQEVLEKEDPADLPPCRRLPPDWRPPGWPGRHEKPMRGWENGIQRTDTFLEDEERFESRRIGVVIHRFLALVGAEGVDAWSGDRIDRLRPSFAGHLLDLGLSRERLDVAIDRVVAGLRSVIVSSRGRWLFDPGHSDVHVEWGLTGVMDGDFVRGVIDRSFVDSANRRWIIDFKTSQNEGEDREIFLENEKRRYQEQMELYARLVGAIESRPIRLGLYFPLMDAWLEWSQG